MPEKLGHILTEDIFPIIKNCSWLLLWERVVDERVGKHTEPVKIKNRTLYVSTSSPTWAQELGYFKTNIIKKFNQLAGEEVIVDIKFRPLS